MNLGKIIGKGNTASVYEWEDGKVLKLFNHGYPYEAVVKEFHNAMELKDMNFSKPKAYEIISYEDKIGIIYDRVNGESLTDWVMKTGNVQECAMYMANLHKAILQNKINNIPNYKDFLKSYIPNILTTDKQLEILQKIDNLSDGNALCHGDFHPGNILISNGNAFVIDFMNICYGNYLYDITRTVFLVEYTPVPHEVKDKDMMINFKRTLTDLYLDQMNVTRDVIRDYLSVIIAVRKWECPDE